MPSRTGGVSGIVKYTVIDSPGVPRLTPLSLLEQVGAVIGLNNNMMELKKIETTTSLRVLPSGRVDHKLTEFAPGGWKAPTPELTELFQVRTEEFRPVSLSGEFRPRPREQCAGFSSGFVYTVRDCSHLSPFHHQRDHDLCVDDTVSTDLPSGDELAQEPSIFECSFASGFDVDANSAMGKPVCWSQRFGGEDLPSGALFTSPEHRGRSCWTRGNKPPLEEFKHRAHVHPNSWFVEPIILAQWTCATKSVEMWHHPETTSMQLRQFPTERQRQRRKGGGKTLPRLAKEPLGLSRVPQPRRTRTVLVRGVTVNFTSSALLQDR